MNGFILVGIHINKILYWSSTLTFKGHEIFRGNHPPSSAAESWVLTELNIISNNILEKNRMIENKTSISWKAFLKWQQNLSHGV